MGDWQDGYFSGSKAGDNLALKPGKDYGWTAVPGTLYSVEAATNLLLARSEINDLISASPISAGWRLS